MCGITGFIDFSRNKNNDFLTAVTKKMSAEIVHRGPDSDGVWTDEKRGVALGFRRLAILDLSVEGAQPMKSADGRFTIVFNGEIYNFLELRAELEKLGHNFRGHSDTEIILAAFVEWNIEATIKKLNGMFAIAVWDERAEELTLIRDRIGKKPLYYGIFGNTLMFGSELKTLRRHPDFQGEIDRESLGFYLKFGYISGADSIYQNVKKLAPAHFVKIKTNPKQIGEQIPYWSLREVAEFGSTHQFQSSEDEIFREFENLMLDSVKRRMLADVPLGAFLSGGIDSSTIVALMQAQSSKPIKTFTIGFHEAEYNEAEHAKRIAEFLKTEHHELYVSMHEAMSVIPMLPTLYDEPFADSSAIPTFLVSKLARENVTVALSGDGGDELFGGYRRYFLAENIWEKIRLIPKTFRKPLSAAMAFTGKSIGKFSQSQAAKGRKSGAAQKLAMLSDFMDAQNSDLLYENLISLWKNPPISDKFNKTKDFNYPELNNFQSRMMLRDALTYLPDDILVKVDRATMGTSLEARAPILDYRVIEFAWRVPQNLKIKGGKGKILLQKLLNKYIPSEITERPKMGFDVPIADWLRNELRDWAENLLDETKIRQHGFLNPTPVKVKWQEHLKGNRNNQQSLWTILMFQSWLNSVKK